MNKYITMLKRECWEYRFSFFLMPAIIAALFVLVAIFATIPYDKNFDCRVDFGSIICHSLDEAGNPDYEDKINIDTDGDFGENFEIGNLVQLAYFGLGIPFLFSMIIVMASYMLSTLNDERKDKSILFWMSFPVSHTETVLTKLFAALVIIPTVTLIAIAGTQLLVSIIATIRLNALYSELMWANLDLISMWTAYVVNYFVFAIASLSAAGLLLISSATTFRPFIMFVLILSGLSVAEYFIVGGESLITRFLFLEAPFYSTSLFGYGLDDGFATNAGFFDTFVQQAKWTLSHPSFWTSAVIGVLMIIGAINMRKYRAEA